MKMRVGLFAAAVMPLGYLPVAIAQQSQPGVPDRLKVTFDTQKTADPVSKYIFGGFIEHIGTTIYRSLWAELLDDRKFYSQFHRRIRRLRRARRATRYAHSFASGARSAPMKRS